MKRIKLTVAYDGTAYCGWQIQPNGVTIEEVLNKALTGLLKEPVTVIGAAVPTPAYMRGGMWLSLIRRAEYRGIRFALH